MDRDSQLSQLRALSLDVLRTCGSRIRREAHVAMTSKKKKNYAIENGTISQARTKVLERLRLTPNPSILHNHSLLLDYFRTLLEPAVFNAFTVNAHVSSADLTTRGTLSGAQQPLCFLPSPHYHHLYSL